MKTNFEDAQNYKHNKCICLKPERSVHVRPTLKILNVPEPLQGKTPSSPRLLRRLPLGAMSYISRQRVKALTLHLPPR